VVEVLSNPATLQLHCGTTAATSLLGSAWKNLSQAGRERRRVWNVFDKLNTCGIASFRTRKEKRAYHFTNHNHRYIKRFRCFKVFCSASKLLRTFGDTSREFCIRNQTWNYFHAFVTTLLQGIELACQERQFTPLKIFFYEETVRVLLYLSCNTNYIWFNWWRYS